MAFFCCLFVFTFSASAAPTLLSEPPPRSMEAQEKRSWGGRPAGSVKLRPGSPLLFHLASPFPGFGTLPAPVRSPPQELHWKRRTFASPRLNLYDKKGFCHFVELRDFRPHPPLRLAAWLDSSVKKPWKWDPLSHSQQHTHTHCSPLFMPRFPCPSIACRLRSGSPEERAQAGPLWSPPHPTPDSPAAPSSWSPLQTVWEILVHQDRGCIDQGQEFKYFHKRCLCRPYRAGSSVLTSQ